MKNTFLTILFCLITTLGFSQVPDAEYLVQAHNVTTAERNAIVSPSVGSIIFDTTEDRLYQYTANSGWIQFSTESDVYVGKFIIDATGETIISGLPFKPKYITFVANANIEQAIIDADNQVGNNNNGINNVFGSMNGFAKDNNGAIEQQSIFVGGSGNSINDISRYSSSTNCIGIRYGNQNGDLLGRTTAQLTSFNATGFTLNVSSKADNLMVIYTAHK